MARQWRHFVGSCPPDHNILRLGAPIGPVVAFTAFQVDIYVLPARANSPEENVIGAPPHVVRPLDVLVRFARNWSWQKSLNPLQAHSH